MTCDSGPATDIGVLMGKCMVPSYDRDEASGAPRAGRGSASFSGLISGVWVLSPALSGVRGAARVQGGDNPISIDQRPKPRKEG